MLTLEIIPVVVTYWRQEELLWERLANLAPEGLRSLKGFAGAIAGGASAAVALATARIYLTIPAGLFVAGQLSATAIFLAGLAACLLRRSAAYAVVWPGPDRRTT